MTDLSREILRDWQVRKTKAQKQRFIEFLQSRLPGLRVEEGGWPLCRNLVLGDPESADVVFTDPPRAGCSKKFLDSLVKLSPKRIVYVSCNPETLARDLGMLSKNGYSATHVQGVDMFPFTEHCECVVSLVKTGANPDFSINDF